MEIYPKQKSPPGCANGEDKTDSCSVDHSGFGLRDESEYQAGKRAGIDGNVLTAGAGRGLSAARRRFWGVRKTIAVIVYVP